MDMIKPNLLALLMVSIIGSTVALSGCSQYKKDQTAHTTATLASQQQAAQMVFDNQASRNNGAWGAIYMTKEELRW